MARHISQCHGKGAKWTRKLLGQAQQSEEAISVSEESEHEQAGPSSSKQAPGGAQALADQAPRHEPHAAAEVEGATTQQDAGPDSESSDENGPEPVLRQQKCEAEDDEEPVTSKQKCEADLEDDEEPVSPKQKCEADLEDEEEPVSPKQKCEAVDAEAEIPATQESADGADEQDLDMGMADTLPDDAAGDPAMAETQLVLPEECEGAQRPSPEHKARACMRSYAIQL